MRRERLLQIRDLSTSDANDAHLEELIRADRMDRERENEEAARRQFEHEAAESEIQHTVLIQSICQGCDL